MSDRFSEIVWLAKQAFGFAVLLWPITLAAFAFVAIAWIARVKAGGKRVPLSRQKMILLFVPALIAVAVLVWGSLMRWPNNGPGLAPEWPLNVIYAAVCVQLIVCIAVVAKASNFRLVASSTAALEFWITLLFANVAGMAVTGNWI